MEKATLANFPELPIPHPSRLPNVEETRTSKSIIKQLDEEIRVIQAKVTSLKTQLHSLRQKRANHASYIAPLRRVPIEILREIVKICWDSGVDMAVLLEGDIRCYSISRLDSVLTRAGKHPLDLTVGWPVRLGQLALISSQK
ncbi:14650_t:CDS:2, partial [Acaulospora colombiana]